MPMELDDYEKRLLSAHRLVISRMRKDPALLDKARDIVEQELRSARKLNPPVPVSPYPRSPHPGVRRLQEARIRGTYYETWWAELVRSNQDNLYALESTVCEDSDFGKALRHTSPLIHLLTPHERDFVEHGFDNWWIEHVGEISANRVYGNKDGEQRLVVFISGYRKNSVVTWRTPVPDLPAEAKAQGSATVASFRRWATKVRPATQADWDAFSQVEWRRAWRKKDAAFYRRYRRKHQTASAY